MVSWRPAGLDGAGWDRALAPLPGANLFQSSAWAAHKADFGWRAVRVLAGPEDLPTAAAQALAKDLPGGARLLWARGGPVGDAGLWDAGLRDALVRAAGGVPAYGRVCSYREGGAAAEASMRAAGWRRPRTPLDRNSTFVLDLSPDADALKAKMSSNWRHNLKRGLARAPAEDWPDPDARAMEALYLEMEALKGLPPQHRADELASMARALGPRLVLRRAVVAGRTVALRACAVFGTSAVDLLAAATAEARKLYASYSLLWELLLEARRRGAVSYDLGGADPDGARGVTDFKAGVGGRPVETVGEWDFARPALLRRPVGALIAWKLGKGA
ncbi:MAG: peptidoglycan bridge formation glycyltransferase FemA/FemB family protein [Elusimicrobia bacterium]|nr:peptidoglycan bridge formation glycyltransferase FemA/FemB family protein [Elusimicrobiota bacterium]